MNSLSSLLAVCVLTAALSVGAQAVEPEAKPNDPASSSYTLRPGDVVHITVWKEDGMDQELTILPDGTVNYPLIGTITIAGKTPAEVQSLVKEKLARLIPAASVTVSVKEARGNSISVVGQVAKPGDILMNRPLTVMQALSQAGGLTTFADDDDLVILRTIDGKETSIPFNYARVADGRALETNIALQPGDVIVVPTASLF